jgi:arylsulfatase A
MQPTSPNESAPPDRPGAAFNVRFFSDPFPNGELTARRFFTIVEGMLELAMKNVRLCLPIFLAAAWGWVAPSAVAARLPNLVIILTDDQGYADVGVYGAKGFKTPNLDRMAREGIRFTDFHAAQPVCSASRAALLTGCYPNRVGIHGALGPAAPIGLHPDEMTLAELVKQKGYATGMVGKWHVGRPAQFLPVHQGFDEYFGLPYSNDMWPFHPEAKPGTYPPLPLIEGDKVVKEALTHDDQAQLTTWYTERAVHFIEKNKDRPFFLYVAHSMPHVPLHVSDKFKGRSKLGLYGDVIMEIDWSVGEILAALKKHGLDRDTLVMFTSDNGPWLSYGDHSGSARPLREGKGTSWEGGTREPFIARWPGTIPAGEVCREMAMTIDIFPTVARLIGAELPARKIDGLDIWPLLSGDPKASNPHEAYFFYYAQNELQAVRSGRWKLVLPHTYRTLDGHPGGHGGFPAQYEQVKLEVPELYDLKRDPREKRNVASKYPDVVRHMETLAEQCREDLGDALTGQKGKGLRKPGRDESSKK